MPPIFFWATIMSKLDATTIRHALYVVLAVAFSALIFYVFGSTLGDAAAFVSVLPVALVAAFFGSRAGLVATTLAFPFNTFVLDFLSGVRNEQGPVTLTRALITLSLVLVSFAFGQYFLLAKKVEVYEKIERKAVATAARVEDRLQTLLAAAPDVIFRVTRTGRLLDVHGPTGAIDKGRYLFRNLGDFLSDELAGALKVGTTSALETNSVQVVIGDADLGGGNRTYEIRLAPDGDDVVGVARDITAQRQAAELERHGYLVSTKDEFVASIAHELRTPLSAIIGFAQELRDHRAGFSEDEQIEMITTIANQAGVLMYRIEDLIVAAKVDVGQVEFVQARFDLNKLTREVIDSFPSGPVRVIGETTFATGDRFRCIQIVRNLVGNAVTHGGGEVFVTVESTDDAVQVGVHDDGPGVGLDHSEDVFAAYRNDADAERQPDRLGLGLVVARQLARLMDGDVIYERKNGLSSFVFSLPKAT